MNTTSTAPSSHRWAAGAVRASALVAATAVVLTSGAVLAAAPASAATSHQMRPVARLVAPTSAIVRGLVTVRLDGSSAPARVGTVTLDFGDHTKKVTAKRLIASTSHRYAKPGHYTITLRLTDKAHHVAKASRRITVLAKAQQGPTRVGLGAAPSPGVTAPAPALDPTTALATSADLTSYAVPVRFQGSLGSCATWAIDYAMYGWYANKQGISGGPFAPMYAFSQITQNGALGGSSPQDALKLAETQGEDTVADYGSGSWDDWATQPTAAQKANAANYRIAGFQVLFQGPAGDGAAGQGSIMAQLAQGNPVAISIFAPKGMTEFHGSIYNDTTSPIEGGHEVLALGYDADGLLIENSWGTQWGSNGYAHLSWAFVQKDVYEAETMAGLITHQSSTDAAAPTVTAPVQTMAPGTTMNSYGAPVTISWSGSDDSGSIAGYSFWASTNGGAWQQQALTSNTATSVGYHLTPGNTYKFAVQARDAAGNVSQWGVGDAFRVDDHSETDSSIRYSTGWQTFPWDIAQGGGIATSSTPKAWAVFTFTGRNVAWISELANNRGQANVFIDGKYVGSPDLYSATSVGRSVEAVLNAGSSGTHTVEIDVVGTAGRPNVDIDSFIVLA